uniref:Very-long-chain 3-oxoacyl-CoA synthase n=1 Tax=Ditylenchus dipsaci TaxID=166011 RepID=A0A915CWT3_9BILA
MNVLLLWLSWLAHVLPMFRSSRPKEVMSKVEIVWLVYNQMFSLAICYYYYCTGQPLLAAAFAGGGAASHPSFFF